MVAKEVRQFAVGLGLSVGDSYGEYEDIGRPYVVWNVFAAPEFSLAPKLFCYPIAGCVSYRGFFKEAAARKFAEKLAKQGYDVYVGGVAAYSTLGWFDDPVLSTFVNRSDAELAALLFHELAHKTLYVKDDSRFNESFATAVEQAALKRWLASRGKPGEYASYEVKRVREQQVVDLIEATNKRLEALYESKLARAEMLQKKRDYIEALRKQYETLRQSWGGSDEFAYWMRMPINNAKLATIATYNDWTGSFAALLADEGGDMPKFLQRVKELARLPEAQRNATLAALAMKQS